MLQIWEDLGVIDLISVFVLEYLLSLGVILHCGRTSSRKEYKLIFGLGKKKWRVTARHCSGKIVSRNNIASDPLVAKQAARLAEKHRYEPILSPSPNNPLSGVLR